MIKSEMYNTLEGLDFGVDYMHITEDGSAISLGRCCDDARTAGGG